MCLYNFTVYETIHHTISLDPYSKSVSIQWYYPLCTKDGTDAQIC